MSNFSKLIVTKAGLNLINENLTTENMINFTGMAASDKTYSVKDIEGLERLEGIKQYTDIRKMELTDEGIIIVDSVFNNRSDELLEGYFIRAVGLFAKSGDKTEILFAAAVETTEHPSYMLPAKTTVTSMQVKFKIKLDNAENIELSVNTAGMATIGDVIGVSDKLKEHENNDIVHVTEDDKDMWNNTLNQAKSYSDSTYRQASGYTDVKIAELIGGAPETLDTLKEVADAIGENKTVMEALDAAVGKKANKSEFDSHDDNKVIHITADERTNWNDAHSKKHMHENKPVLDNITSVLIEKWNSAVSHISDVVRHITSDERNLWNTVRNKADTSAVNTALSEVNEEIAAKANADHIHNYAGSDSPGGMAKSAVTSGSADYVKGNISNESISVDKTQVSQYDSIAVFSGNNIRSISWSEFCSRIPTYSAISVYSGYLLSGIVYPFGSGTTYNTILNDLSADNLRGKTILGGFITFEEVADSKKQYISGYVDVIGGECIRAVINNRSENAVTAKVKYMVLFGTGIGIH